MRLLTRTLILSLLLVPSPGRAIPIAVLDTGTAAFVGQSERGPLDEPLLVTAYEEFVDHFGASTAGLANPFLAPSVAGFFANGGQRLYVVRVATSDPLDLVGADGGAPGTRTGLQTLLDVDEVAMVAIPGAVALTVQAALVAHAEAAGDRVAILDPATTDDLQLLQDQRAALTDAAGHAALYFPWVWAAPAGESLLLPPSGLVAGVFARSGTADSPVGSLATATGVSHVVTTPEQDVLNPLGINAIRLFSGNDVRVWGARTLADDPEWRYLAVRRTAFCVAESIDEGTAWCVSEPNAEPLWAQLRADVSAFLYGRWVAGWFQGVSPDDAFFVRCDTSTMTADDIDAGRTIILIGFAPLQPAEFIVLSVVHERSAVGVAPGTAGPMLHAAAPNPFNPRTVIGFSLDHDGPVNLRVYDLGGRLVRTLVDGRSLPAGRHARAWDGRDQSGTGMPSGVYLVRLQTAGTIRSGRITLVR